MRSLNPLGARVVTHGEHRRVVSARSTGLTAAPAGLVAYRDDREPAAGFAECVLAGHPLEGVVGVRGPIRPGTYPGDSAPQIVDVVPHFGIGYPLDTAHTDSTAKVVLR